jgi:predicted transcriptional regulator
MNPTESAATSSESDEAYLRAQQLRTRLAKKAVTLAEFGRQTGLTRNVVYGLSKGRAPSVATQKKIDAFFRADRAPQ